MYLSYHWSVRIFEGCLIASRCLAPWLVMLRHHMTLSHVFRDLILDHVFRGCGSFDGFELGRLSAGLTFCTAIVVIGKTCL